MSPRRRFLLEGMTRQELEVIARSLGRARLEDFPEPDLANAAAGLYRRVREGLAGRLFSPAERVGVRDEPQPDQSEEEDGG